MVIDQTEHVDDAGFKAAMQSLAATVTVVAIGGEHLPLGMSVTAVMSLSATPPTVVVSLNRESSVGRALCEGGSFSINLLSHDQRTVCEAFGGGCTGADKFQHGTWTYEDDRAPVLTDALGTLFCRVEKRVEYASHALVVSTITGLRVDTALIYLKRDFLCEQIQ